MSNFVDNPPPPLSNSLWVAMETMHFHIAHTNFLRTTSFRIQGVPINNLAPMKNCPGVQGNLNWMPGQTFLFAPLALSVYAGCSAFPFNTPTKP